MATVVGLMRDQRDSRADLTVVATYVDDTALVRLVTACWGLAWSVLLILAGRVDVVHVHLAHRGSVVRKALPLLVARRRGIPAVVHAHSYDFAGWYDSLPAWGRSTVRWALPACQWIVLGEGLVEPYRDRLDLASAAVRAVRNPAPVVPRPIDSDGIGPDGMGPDGMGPDGMGPDGMGPDGMGRGVVRAVSLGRMGERKGTYDLLDALTRVSGAARSALQVVLAGDGELDEVRAVIDRKGLGDLVEVQSWLGPADRDALLASADVFLLPSHAEGLPMALLEAMSAGLVPVVTTVGAIGEVVEDDVTAVVVPPGDPTALARSIEALVADPGRRRRLAEGALAAAHAWSVTAWFDQLVDVWTAALLGPAESEASGPPAAPAPRPRLHARR